MRDEIDREFGDVLAKMTVLLYGPAQAFDKSGGRSSEHPGGRRPTGDNYPLHEEFREKYAQAVTRAERALVLADAIEARQRVLKGPQERPEETPEQREQRMIDDYAGWPAKDVALAMRTSASEVRHARARRALDPDTGEDPLEVPTLSAAERQEKARRMKDQGMSAKRIALVLGVHYDTVRRDLGRKSA